MNAAINVWPGATINPIEPAPGTDGRAFIAWKVTGPVAGVWHYEYALYNENLDRAIQSFSLPLGCGITVGTLGFTRRSIIRDFRMMEAREARDSATLPGLRIKPRAR